MKTATNYLKTLSEIITKAQVTGNNNEHLSLDTGAKLATEMILTAKIRSNKVIIIGNGGSAAIASHIQNDLCKAVGVRGMVFTEQPLMMALANDDGYETIFQSPMELWTEPEDVLISISSSGRSKNILKATKVALENRCKIITMTGFALDNPLRNMGHINFYLSSDVYGHVETGHSAIAHFITDNARSLINDSKNSVHN